MKNIMTIVKKELKRVFTDYRVMFSLFLLPPVTIYLIYGLMGVSAEKQSNEIKEHVPKVVIVNSPEAIGDHARAFKLELVDLPDFKADLTYESELTEEEIEFYKKEIRDDKIDLMIEFPSNFENLVLEYETTNEIPNIEYYYNINNSFSKTTFLTFQSYLSSYENLLIENRVALEDLNIFDFSEVGIGSERKAGGQILSMILPLLLVIYLMAGALSVGIESISGEKERGTIATLLITPIKRSELAIGKIISISILGLLSSIASFLGLVAVMPQFAKISGQEGGGGALGDLGYGMEHYGMLLSIMVTAVLLFVALVVIVSAYAKTVKEAGTLIMPLYIAVMGAAMFTMFTEQVPKEFGPYSIPVYNIILSLKAILMFEMEWMYYITTIISTLAYTLILVFLIQKMFKSEKVMFNR